MNYVSLEDFKKSDEYQTFIKENPSVGKLKIQAFTAYQSVPIPDTDILISKNINDNNVLFFKGKTDSSGMIENIELPAPVAVEIADIDNIPKYTVYDITAIHQGFETIKKYKVAMFGDVNIIQYIKMILDVGLKGVDQVGD